MYGEPGIKTECSHLELRVAAVFVEQGKFSNFVLSKTKEEKVYEEISGVFCSVSVFCDLFVDGLQSIIAAGETGRGEGSPWSPWSPRSPWCAWQPLERLRQKRNRGRISGYILAKRIYPLIFQS